MSRTRVSAEQVRNFILNNVQEHPSGISRMTADHFKISRQTAHRHVNKLIHEGQLKASGTTNGRIYELVTLLTHRDEIAVSPKLEEHVTWRETIVPYLTDVKENVLAICQYGFTEMVNNVVSHSGAGTLTVIVERNPVLITLSVSDNGIGVFTRLQQAFGYDDPRHALLELSKGKVTSDPERHTGEGIFFTSRMFDDFSIWSGTLFYARLNRAHDWLIEVVDRQSFLGTFVQMKINTGADLTTKEIFDQYATGEDKDFSKTHVPILLARYEQEQLMSRSQARRVLARFDRFREVLLDFRGVEMIGQSFADEIFRVFHREHPEIEILEVNTSPEIDAMIRHVTSQDATGTLPLF